MAIVKILIMIIIVIIIIIIVIIIITVTVTIITRRPNLMINLLAITEQNSNNDSRNRMRPRAPGMH